LHESTFPDKSFGGDKINETRAIGALAFVERRRAHRLDVNQGATEKLGSLFFNNARRLWHSKLWRNRDFVASRNRIITAPANDVAGAPSAHNEMMYSILER
jgi:hypothetical protein